jgi:hypothetical protein
MDLTLTENGGHGEEATSSKENEVTSEPESDEPPLVESMAAEERDRRRRWNSLRGLYGVSSSRAGRDWFGQIWNQVSGGGSVNHAGRDLNFNLFDGTPTEVAYLHRETADTLLNQLVETPSLERLSQVVAGEAVVLLRGPEETGRTTAALAALIRWVRAVDTPPKGETEEKVGRIRTVGRVGRGSFPELQERHGYLLDATHDDLTKDVDYLRDLALKSDCRLVILVSRGQANLPARPIDHRPPPAIDVFRHRLVYEARIAGVDPQLPPDVMRKITESLRGETSPRRAADQACEVVEGVREGRTHAEILDELPARMREHIRERLDKGQPVVGRCFMAGIAVLHDLPEVTVSQAALALADQIYKSWHIKKARRTPPTWEQLDKWLEYAGAEARRPGRPGSGRVVRLNRSRASAETIHVLWEDHPTIREPLILWLINLGTSPDPEVQVHAAHAVGKLATLDFDTVRERFLTPWSRSQKPDEHRLAALALEAAAQEPWMKFRVHEHLRTLAESHRHGDRTVAIQAYGSSIGAEAIGEALSALHRISMALHLRLNQDAARTIAYLYSARTATTIIRELASWIDARSGGGRYTAALAFARLANPISTDPDRPALVEFDMTDELVRLWQNALTLRIVPPRTSRPRPAVAAAWGMLGDWVCRYEERPAIGSVVDGVIRAADSTAARLYLRLWHRRDRISNELYDHLSRLANGGTACS